MVFGGKKVPEMMRGLGQGVKEFKKGMKEGEDTSTTGHEEASSNEEGISPTSKHELDNQKDAK